MRPAIAVLVTGAIYSEDGDITVVGATFAANAAEEAGGEPRCEPYVHAIQNNVAVDKKYVTVIDRHSDVAGARRCA